ncbi:MAG: CxxxxCH/CxxCH domain-containing protein, partial [Pseudomonadota bacterium]
MKLSIFKHVIISGALLAFYLPSADAAMQCNGCHGTSAPVDYRPLDEAGRNPATGGFQGNHRTHMDAPAAPAACDTCHPGSSTYISAHRDGKIKLSTRINNSPLTTIYKNSTSAFNQSATPSLGSCGNVNCHFENITPVWGSDPAATSCTTCHGAPPNGGSSGAAGSHAKHAQYFPGTSNCLKCHANNTSFQHATSAGNRNLAISFA